MIATKLRVALPPSGADHSYDILIGSGLLAQAGAAIADRLGQRTCLIVSDTNVAAHYATPLTASLTAAGHRCLTPLLIPPGEGSKNFGHFARLAESALALQPDRKLLIVALGGGVVGDMAGLLAALLLRGVDFVQIPTTLLAQVDSSVGGKTGIDSLHGKNLIGAFYQPRLVLADTAVLRTLPGRERAAGFAEVIKYGLIDQPDFFAWCEQNGAAVLAGDSALQAEAVRVSCAAKAAIVAADEREAGKRALLNLGHTFGHALEVVSGFGDGLLHGEAVAIGCALAIRYSIAQGQCAPEVLPRYEVLCRTCQLPTVPLVQADVIPQLLQAMAGDKKNRDGAVTLILLRGIGQAFVQPGVTLTQLEDFWRSVI